MYENNHPEFWAFEEAIKNCTMTSKPYIESPVVNNLPFEVHTAVEDRHLLCWTGSSSVVLLLRFKAFVMDEGTKYEDPVVE